MKKSNLPFANGRIKSEEVRLVDKDGEMVGVVALEEALRQAKAVSLDLVEVSPNAKPPVCKILDFGKFKYALQKKANDAKKKQKTVTLKEIKIRPNIGEHDFQIKLRAALKFLDEGNKVKISLRFKGREIAKQDIAFELMKKFKEATEEHSAIELAPKMEMRQLMMILKPLK